MECSQRLVRYAGLGAATVGLAYKLWSLTRDKKAGLEYCVLLGDVGGTNVRLSEVTFTVQDGRSSEQGPIANPVIYQSQEAKSIEEAIEKYLSDRTTAAPTLCVLGVAGEVTANKAKLTCVEHWPQLDGEAIAKAFGFVDCTLVNDFVLAGLGVSVLEDSEIVPMNEAMIEEGRVKIVAGPGTGLGEAFLCKSQFGENYDCYPSEGAHADFCPRSDEDFELFKFAMDFIEKSKNVENQRSAGKLDRLSAQRLTAGPAVPLIYEFFKSKIPATEMKRCLESGPNPKHPDDITSHDIVLAAMSKTDADPLCLKVVEKFSELLAVEIGDLALKTLPFGGIYLVGGVTEGIKDHLLGSDNFNRNFCAKDPVSDIMKRFPIFYVEPTDLGLRGAAEAARRIFEERYVL